MSDRRPPRDVLTEASLPVEYFIADDGLPGLRVRGGPDAADVALDALTDAGWRLVPDDAVVLDADDVKVLLDIAWSDLCAIESERRAVYRARSALHRSALRGKAPRGT